MSIRKPSLEILWKLQFKPRISALYWSAMITSILYIPLSLPGSYNLDKLVNYVIPTTLSGKENVKPQVAVNCEVYKKRWIILSLFCIFTVFSSVHWIQYSVIADVMVQYYGVTNEAVNWSTMVNSLLYIVLSFPGSYTLDKLGLRTTILISVTGTCIGAWVKMGSIDPNRYWVVILGQCIVFAFQVFSVPMPTKLAATWFPEKEVPLAFSICYIAMMIGIGLGFLIPPLLIPPGSIQEIEKGLFIVTCSYAVLLTVSIPLMYFYFDDAPSTPPSIAELLIHQNGKLSFNFKKTFKNLFSNRSFMSLVVIYGVNTGISLTITTLMNQIILVHYPFAQKDVGILGLLYICTGLGGTYLIGYVLGRTKKYKQITIAAVLLSIISLAGFLFLINQGLVLVYIFVVCMSAFSNNFYCIGIQLGIELTYPESEGSMSGLLFLSQQAFAIFLTYTYSYIFYYVNESSANWYCLAVVFLSDCFLLLIKFDLKRQSVSAKENKS